MAEYKELNSTFAYNDSQAANLKVDTQELILFTTQLSIMLESGVVLSDALDAIAKQTKPGVMQNVIDELSEMIKGGKSFSDVLSRYPRIFDSMFISMIKTSELTGKTSEMLDILSSYLNAEAETRRQVKSAMIYPLIMLCMAIAATGSLMFFVLPRFTKIYESRGASLPGLTNVLVKASQLLGNVNFLAIAFSTVLVMFFLVSWWKKTVSGRRTIDYSKMHMPIMGNMFVDTILTRSMRIIATMVNAGVSLLDAISVAEVACDNIHFRQLWAFVDKKIRDGYQFSDAIMIAPNNHVIAPGIIQMIKAGEKSGRLGHVCDKVSILYEKRLQNSIKTATSMIEPIMIIVMGGIIGTIAIALLLPVFRISSVIAQ